MKTVRILLAALFLFGPLPLVASAGNGVERGAISFGDTAVPEVLRNQLELMLFAHCDLRGALDVTPTYVKETTANMEAVANYEGYDLELAARFDNGLRTVFISVTALVQYGTNPKASILRLESPICVSIR